MARPSATQHAAISSETGVKNTEKRKKAITSALIREEIRKLNLIGKSQIHRSFDEEAAIDLVLKLGLTSVTEVGTCQAVAIARAIELETKLIILDEPTAALAVAETRKVLT
jgi:ABC-type sugar transport system ATPase subunit